MSSRPRPTAANLDERIAAAFGDNANSSQVADVIQEVEAAALSSAEAAERARVRALDPAISAVDVAAARREMEDAAFRRDRLQEAMRRLGERLREVKAQEEQARRCAAHDEALTERDKLAAELLDVYPQLAEKLADLAGRIAANDAVIERINRKLPDGAKWLANAELVARGLRGFQDTTGIVPRIVGQMRLPTFRYSGKEPYTWPRPAPR
jgi:chromosome segregation ATPase